MSKVLITGASGLIGSYLSHFLKEKGFEVLHLSRNSRDNEFTAFSWIIEEDHIEQGALENVEHIIHLAGAGIADKRWSEKRKKEIINSRVNSANMLFKALSDQNIKLKTFISASAIGYYGALTSEKIFSEEDSAGEDFQSEVCRLWEKSADQFIDVSERVTKLRFGVVLSENGGALKKLLLPTKLGLGSGLGSGKQYFPWIHIRDAARIIHKVLVDSTIKGTYNLVAPNHTTNHDFSKILAGVLKKPFFMPNVPAFALKLIFGEMSQILLEGSRISSEKIQSTGFEFKFGHLDAALDDLVN